MENIILIGFMGCGKTTVGKKLASMSGRKFLDMDDEIVRRAGMKITEIFEKYGEDRFRQMETELCEQLVRNGRTCNSNRRRSYKKRAKYAAVKKKR